MALPTINLSITNSIWGLPMNGNLVYKYSPFQNLQKIDVASEGNDGLTNLRLTSVQANIDTTNPLVLNIEKSYDGSANLIISDKTNPLKIINSRFYLINSNEFVIADRRGNLDTNIYTEENFAIETRLIKTVRSIITLDFEGIEDGGILPVGNYNFYFKLADYDGNESDFISESGQVVCYIGSVNNPISIRGGQLDETSNKLVKFKLNNLDLAYDYINVYYTRSTGDSLTDNVIVNKITNKFKILGSSTKISITGYEESEIISLSDINIKYANFDSVKTTTSCQNMVFVGNITNDYTLFTLLEKYSLLIAPTLTHEEHIGNLTNNYLDIGKNANEYYNPNNIYYRLGLWDEEIYRLGIVYILNNYTLSPVFNIRGKKEVTLDEGNPFDGITYSNIPITEEIHIDDNYVIIGTDIQTTLSLDENTKGVFKINSNSDDVNSNKNIFNKSNKIRPIGVKLYFHNDIINGSGLNYPAINEITKGFFIVRQKRIPNILAQGLSIGTSIKGHLPTIKASSTVGGMYLLESFLQKDGNTDIPVLGRSVYGLSDSQVLSNALLCPEANLRSSIYGSLFNSSSFLLKPSKYIPVYRDKFIKLDMTDKIFALSDLEKNLSISEIPDKDTELLLVNPNTTLINNKDTLFSSVAGNENEAWKHTDPINGDIEDMINPLVENIEDDKYLSRDFKKTRGIFNSYVGSSKTLSGPGIYYNIYNKNYDFNKWKDYFNIRYNDSSPFYPMSDRTSWSQIDNTLSCYRGDCYISTYAHRMMWNFIDPELPTNKRIIDKYTWFKNYKIKTIRIKANNNDFVLEDTSGEYGSASNNFIYRKLLPVFTYMGGTIVNDMDTGVNISTLKILTPEAKKYNKYSESNGIFGANKINRPDINAVGLGHWVVFKICSNINLALRDEDFSNPAEEALHKRKRSFYPYNSADQYNKLPESNIINAGISRTIGNKLYFEIPDVPFIQTYFNNRIYASNLLIESIFKNGNRTFKYDNYQDYTMEHGQLIKLVEWYGKLIAVMEHGILMIPVNERAMMTNATGENVYINTESILPKNPQVISNMFGSNWSESVVKTPSYVYGIDTVGKKIWRTNGEGLEIISDMKIQKFLNDNINLKITDRSEVVTFNLIKSHYNAFKRDVIFTYKYGTEKWSLCWNEILNKWVTRYTWFPEFSENINNIFYTFAYVEDEFLNDITTENYASKGKLFKHGFAGTLEQQNAIKPTVWYEEQHPFEFEFVVVEIQGIQKIFDNLKIISNKAEPNSFTFEIVGEGYDWYKYKEVISWMENHSAYNDGEITEDVEFVITEDGYYSIKNPSTNYYDGYEYLLTHTIDEIETEYPNFPTPFGMSGSMKFIKLPYIPKVKQVTPLDDVDWETLNYNLALIDDEWNGEDRLLSYQEGKALNKYGRLKGNMHYVEDSWDVQIQPIRFRYAFLKNDELTFTSIMETKIRDKYLKVKVIYDGTKLAIINAIKTLFTLSYA